MICYGAGIATEVHRSLPVHCWISCFTAKGREKRPVAWEKDHGSKSFTAQ